MNETELIASVPTKLWIAGRSVDARSGKTFPVHNPATGEPITEVADAGPEDAMAALDAAVAVQGEWAATPPRQRGEILRAVFEKLTERADDIALLMTLEMGKAIAESKSEADLRRGVLPLVQRRGGADRGPLPDRARRQRPDPSCTNSPSGRAWRSRPGTSRSRWAPARSGRRWRRGAR